MRTAHDSWSKVTSIFLPSSLSATRAASRTLYQFRCTQEVRVLQLSPQRANPFSFSLPMLRFRQNHATGTILHLFSTTNNNLPHHIDWLNNFATTRNFSIFLLVPSPSYAEGLALFRVSTLPSYLSGCWADASTNFNCWRIFAFLAIWHMTI